MGSIQQIFNYGANSVAGLGQDAWGSIGGLFTKATGSVNAAFGFFGDLIS